MLRDGALGSAAGGADAVSRLKQLPPRAIVDTMWAVCELSNARGPGTVAAAWAASAVAAVAAAGLDELLAPELATVVCCTGILLKAPPPFTGTNVGGSERDGSTASASLSSSATAAAMAVAAAKSAEQTGLAPAGLSEGAAAAAAAAALHTSGPGNGGIEGKDGERNSGMASASSSSSAAAAAVAVAAAKSAEQTGLAPAGLSEGAAAAATAAAGSAPQNDPGGNGASAWREVLVEEARYQLVEFTSDFRCGGEAWAFELFGPVLPCSATPPRALASQADWPSVLLIQSGRKSGWSKGRFLVQNCFCA
eukprot:365212-Chlamydomonas_euryale.AAC.7